MFQEIEATKSFLETLNTIEYEWGNWVDGIKLCDAERQDLLHELELTKFDIQRGYRLSKDLQDVSLRRRRLKDIIDITRPLKEFMDSNKTLKINLFKVMTAMKQTEEHFRFRKYTPRVRTDITLADGRGGMSESG